MYKYTHIHTHEYISIHMSINLCIYVNKKFDPSILLFYSKVATSTLARYCGLVYVVMLKHVFSPGMPHYLKHCALTQ